MEDVSKSYWNEAEASEAGMLNNNTQTAAADEKCSLELLQGLIQRNQLKTETCLDVGAGIGRVSQKVLSNFFSKIDFLEREPRFTAKIEETLKNTPTLVGSIFTSSMEDFTFTSKYDCIWAQWCLEYLSDSALVEFLSKCAESLSPEGLIILKENVIFGKTRETAPDGAVIRTVFDYKKFFSQAGLSVKKEFSHPNWPKDLYKVNVYVLNKG